MRMGQHLVVCLLTVAVDDPGQKLMLKRDRELTSCKNGKKVCMII